MHHSTKDEVQRGGFDLLKVNKIVNLLLYLVKKHLNNFFEDSFFAGIK